MKKIFLLISFLLAAVLYAQEDGRIRGFVRDSLNGEALAYSNIIIKELNRGTTTNERGYYYFNGVRVNVYTLLVSYVGYQTKEIQLYIAPNKTTQVDIELIPKDIQLNEVEKIAQAVDLSKETNISIERIDSKKLERLPKSVETDLIRSLQFIPGVKSTGDASAKYYVRGGSSDQNLILMNGVTIYNPFHALGLFSVVDPDMINSIEFYKGAFNAKFGERISSVLNVVTKDGNNKKAGLTTSASFLSGKLLFETPFPNGSLMINGRKSFSSEVLNKFYNDQKVPADFYDLSFKLNYADDYLNKNGRYFLFGFFSNDELDYGDPTQPNFSWETNLIGFEWVQTYDSPLFSTFRINYSGFEGNTVQNASSLKSRKNLVRDIGISGDFTFLYDSRDELSTGILLKIIKTELIVDQFQNSPNNINETSGNLVGYASYKLARYKGLIAEAGLRINLVGLQDKGHFFPQPRLSAAYSISEKLKLKTSLGLYQQEVAAIADEDEVISIFDPWIILPDNLTPTRSFQTVAGIEYAFTDFLKLDLEGYYKTISNLPTINDEKFLESDPNLIAGKGEAYGLESNINFSYGRIYVNTAYTLSWSFKEVNGERYSPRYDSRHALDLTLDYNLGKGWQFSALWTYHSGQPFTQLVGYYNKFYINDLESEWNQIGNYLPYAILSGRNLGRLPDYHRLDLSLSKLLELGFMKLKIDVSAVNVYNRDNIFYFERDTGKKVNMLPFLPTATIKLIL
ncbi:MAG: TonB-dependent receptor [Melioribacteraceae bacterium]|nr:TonB-dependent receptor [Melioribacteraceae bacterium]